MASGGQVTAIIPVHYGGQIGDVRGISALARKYNLHVIEDAAHCCPAYYRDDSESPWKSVGTEAEISCFSFYANKTITTGEGGMACSKSQEYADRMRVMSLHGISRDAWKRYTSEGSWHYEIVAPGFKYNLTDIAAAIGLHQLRKADQMHNRRTQLAALYSELLSDMDEVILPSVMPNRIHSWHLFAIRLNVDESDLDRAKVISQLKEFGIGTSVHWLPLHMHPYYREAFGYKPHDCPCAMSTYPGLITLPLYPDLKPEEVEYVCRTLKGIVARSRAVLPGASLPVSA